MTKLPPYQHVPSAWYGPEMERHKDQWLIMLSDAEIAELETAAETFLHRGTALQQMTMRQFPLPTLGSKLNALRAQLIDGIGFFVLRGLPAERYREEQSAAIFFGIGMHLGNARSQNAAGDVLGHVRNMGLSGTDPGVRIYQTSERQTFHTDSSDVVGLLCLQPAKEGGLSLLVSATTVFNEMRTEYPDLLSLLMEPIATDRRGEVPEGMLPYLLIPVFSYFEGQITPFYQRQYIESAQRFDDAPRLTQRHREALDCFDALCNAPRLQLSMMLQRGDMQFVYNHALLHDRTAFTDWPEPGQRRHLLRLWLSVPGDRGLPGIFATRFGSVEIGNRGGIIVSRQ